MSTRPSFSDLVAATAARWPVIVAAMLAAALVGAVYGWSTRPEAGYTAEITIRYVPPAGVTGAPQVDTFVAMAVNASVQATAAIEAGIDKNVFAGNVKAATSARDKSLVVIQATNPDKDTAVAMAQALAQAAATETLKPSERYRQLYADRVARDSATVAAIQARIDQVESQLKATNLDPTLRASLESALYTEQLRLTTASDAQESNLFTLDTYNQTAAQLGAATVSSTSSTGYLLSAAIRGAAIGLFIGILAAGILARRKPQDVSAKA